MLPCCELVGTHSHPDPELIHSQHSDDGDYTGVVQCQLTLMQYYATVISC